MSSKASEERMMITGLVPQLRTTDGPFEIRPANEAINALIAERDAAVAKEV